MGKNKKGKNKKATRARAAAIVASGVVLQGDHPMGCGVACVASVLRISYVRARALFAKLDGDDLSRGFSRRALIAALKRGGRVYSFHILRDLDLQLLPIRSIVFLRDEQHPPGHYLVKRSDGWMDPLRATVRKRLTSRPLSYICPA